MGVEAYIDIKLYNSATEKENIHHAAFNRFVKYIVVDVYNNSSDFDEDGWFENEIKFDEKIYVTPTDTVCDLIRSKPSFILKRLQDIFMKNIKKTYCVHFQNMTMMD